MCGLIRESGWIHGSYILTRDRVAFSPLQVVIVSSVDGFRRESSLRWWNRCFLASRLELVVPLVFFPFLWRLGMLCGLVVSFGRCVETCTECLDIFECSVVCLSQFCWECLSVDGLEFFECGPGVGTVRHVLTNTSREFGGCVG